MQNRIRELRKKRGITMKELGKVLGVAESTISQYELDKRQPDNKTLLSLADFFGVSVDYLLGKPVTPWPANLFEGVGHLDLSGSVFHSASFEDPLTKKILDLSREMSEEEKRQLLLAARLIAEQRSEK